MNQIEEIIKASSKQVKEILLEQAGRFGDFPTTMIGIRDKKYVDNESCIAEGLFSSVNVRLRGIALPKQRIVVYNADKFWTDNHFVLMLPDGLYRFSESMFITSRDGKLTNWLDGYPDWESKTERPLDYLVHGRRALYEMQNLFKEQKVSCSR